MKRNCLVIDSITNTSDSQLTLDTQLIEAVKDASMESVQQLLAAGAKPNDSISSDGPLLLLVLSPILSKKYGIDKYGINNCLDIAELLIKAGADLKPIENQLIYDVITFPSFNTLRTLKFLFDHQVSPLAKHKGLSALHLICKLLKKNIKSNIEFEIEETNLDIAKLLIKQGADINAFGDGMSPLHYLCYIGNIDKKLLQEQLKKLTEESAKKRVEKEAKKLEKYQKKLAKILINKKNAANTANLEILYDGMTSLQHAIKNNLPHLVEILIQFGANFLTPYQGKTAIENADNLEIKETLINAIKSHRPDEWKDELLISHPKENEKKIKQSLRLFGHLFNDIDLSSSSIQGFYFFDTLTYMHDFVNRFLNNKIFFQDVSSEKAIKIKSSCQELLELLTTTLQSLNYSNAKAADMFIQLFEQKGRILIPGGFFRHGMMHEFKKDENGDCILLVWNTGRGLYNHLYEDTSDNRLFNLIKAYKMPPYPELNKTLLKDYISLLLELSHGNNKETSNANILYKEILPSIAALKGIEFNPDFLNYKYEGQWSGTCAWQVVMMMSKHYGFKELNADEFQYEVLIDGLEWFLNSLTDDDYQNQAVIQQLQYAIKNFALFLKKIDQNHHLSPVKKERALIMINKVNDELKNSHIPLTKKEVKLEFHPNPSLLLPPCISSIENKIFEEESNLQYQPFQGYQPLDKVYFVSAQELKMSIQEILNISTADHNIRINLLRRIENIIFNLPNLQAYWVMSPEEINQFIHLLTLFSEKYYKLCQILNYHYAENIVALKICYGLGFLLAKMNDPTISLDEQSRQDVFRVFNIQVSSVESSPLEKALSSEHFTISEERVAKSILKFPLPEIDYIFHQIDSLSVNKKLKEEAINQIYSLDGRLSQYSINNISNIPPQSIPALYYYLTRKYSAGLATQQQIEHRYPEIERNFQILFSVSALKDLYHLALGGFIDPLQEIQINKWNLFKIKVDSFSSNINFEFKLAKQNDSKAMTQSHHIENDKIAEDLNANIYSNTQIGIRIYSRPLSKETDFRRRLAHIHSRPESKIVATIEFIKSSLVQLNSKDLQTCIFLYLFQGDNLLNEIKINPDAIIHLFNCIEKGIQYYQGQKSVSTLLFFYKLNTFLVQFLIHTNLENRSSHESWIEQGLLINNHIEKIFNHWIHHSRKNQYDQNILAMINSLQFLHLANLYTFSGKLSDNEWNLFFISNCLHAQLPIENLDRFIIKEVDKAVDKLRYAAIIAMKNTLPTFLLNVCDFFKIKFDTNNFQGSFPYFYDNDNGIDLLNGVITKKNVKENIIPPFFYNNNQFKTLFGLNQINATKTNVNSYQFTFNNYLFRAATKDEKIIIQKNDFGKWFQLLKNEELENIFRANSKILLPLTLIDDTKFCWQAQDGSYLITEKKSGKNEYLYDGIMGTFYKLNHYNELKWQLDRSRELRVINNFEDPAYTEIWHDTNSHQLIINLPRYGLQFYSVPHAASLQLICSQYEDYQLVLNKKIPIKNFEHALVLEPINTQSNLDTLYLVPKQVFLPSFENEDDTYAKLEFDIQNKFKSEAFLIKKLNKKYGQAKLAGFCVVIAPEKNNYYNQEHLAVYRQTPDGQLAAQNVSDQFYLAYLYFSKREPEKCYSLLKTLIHNVSNNLDDLTYLRYIVTETPCQIIDKTQAKECTSRGPEYLAIRLFVLYMLIEFLKKGEELKLSSPSNLQGEVNNESAILTKERQEKFLSAVEFQNILKMTLFQYLLREKSIPQSMQLNSMQLNSLLSGLDKTNQEIVIFKAKKQQLELERDAKEYQALSNLDNGKLEEQESIRKYNLQQNLEKEYFFTPITQHLEDEKKSICLYDLKKASNPITSTYATLTISDLSLKTETKILSENILHLFNEAMQNSDKEKWLVEFLSYKLQCILGDEKWFLEKRGASVKATLLLMMMLKNKVKTQAILSSSKLSNDQLISNLLNHFQHEIYSDVIKVHVPVINLDNEFKIENKSALKYKPIFTSNIKPLAKKPVDIHHEGQNDLFWIKGNHPFLIYLAKEMNADLNAGEKINIEEAEINNQYLKIYSHHDTRKNLSTEIDRHIIEQQPILDNLKNEIEFIINSGSRYINDHGSWEISKISRSIKQLTWDEALNYYGKYHFSEIQEKRCLSEETTHYLIKTIQKYLIEATHQQKCERIKSKLIEITECEDEISKNYLIIQLGSIITQTRCYEPEAFPKILLFEYRENKLIYEIQYRIILKLLEKDTNGRYLSRVIQHIMGGGKSTIIFPLLLSMRANGTNLCIAEVPFELFETVSADISLISYNNCNQKAFTFKFHRNIQCDADYFSYLKTKFEFIIAKKHFILTTKKYMDSFLAKCINMLSFPETSPEKYEDYLKAIEYISDIMNILANQADVIIEEIDTTLNPKDQLIYTVGESNPVEKHLLNAIVSFYDFLPENFIDIIKNETGRPRLEILNKWFDALISDLITSSSSPISSIINKLEKNNQEQVFHYLKNETIANYDNIFKLLTPQEQDLLALCKEELSTLLPTSLMKNCDEHYGLPKDKKKNPLARAIAIPYLGNNSPNEPAHFQNHFLTINCTIQAQLRTSLSYPIFEIFINDIKEQYEIEKTVKVYCENFVNHVQSDFEKIINRNDLQLDDICLDNHEQMHMLYQQLKDEANLKKHCLVEFILPSISKSPVTLATDSQNHIMYHTACGFTGTDYNFLTFHPSFIRDNSESFGTDGQTIDSILKSSNQRTHVLKEDKFSEIFAIIKEHPQRGEVRAIIDRGAIFKGIRNREVANKLSLQFSHEEYQKHDIKYILYFNSKNKLRAIKISKNPENEKPIKLGGTKNIDKKLKCAPHQRFTFYSQNDTTGMDINQAIKTIGLLTLSEHNTLRDFLQAAARLRDLKRSHSIEPIIMKGLASANPHITPEQWNKPTIMNVTFQTQAKVLMGLHLISALQKIRDVFRSDLLRQIRMEKDIKEKIELAKDFRNYLYNRDTHSFFEKYGAPETMIETELFLINYQNDMAQRWLDCFKNKEKKEKMKLLQTHLIQDRCQKIIEKSIEICEKLQKSNINFDAENQVIAEKETQNECQQQNEIFNEVEYSSQTSVGYLSWEKTDWNKWCPHENAIVPCYKLDDVTLDPTHLRDWNFSENIYLSYNFLNTCKEAPEALNTFSKTGYYTMVTLDKGAIKHILITEKEAVEIRATLPSQQENIWIETLSGIPYAGKKFKGIEEVASYQNNIEQLQFFNGDLAYLIDKGGWFKQNREAKLDFLENKILPNHPSKASLLSIFKKKIRSELIDPNVNQTSRKRKYSG